MENMFQEAVMNKHFPRKWWSMTVTVFNFMFPQQWPLRVWSLGFQAVYSPNFTVIQPRRTHSLARLLLGNSPSNKINEFYVLLIFCMNEVHVLYHIRSERMEGTQLCVFFSFAVKTGSFVYDVNVGLDNWQPSQVRNVCVYTRMHAWACQQQSI